MAVKTILAAFALEAGDDPVPARAVSLARQHGARLIVLHVIEALPDDSLPATVNGAQLVDLIRSEADSQIRAALDGAEAEIHIETGRPYEAIDRLAAGADLIVIGEGTARNLRERMFGSTADRVVRGAEKPVLVVKNPGNAPYAKLAAATDFSACSLAAARLGAEIAPDAVLQLVHAVEIPLGFEQAMRKAGTSESDIEAYRRARLKSARKALQTACSEANLPETVQPRAMPGHAVPVLARLARRGEADLVAIGARGAGGASRMMLGSVARRALQLVPSDILIVPTDC